MTFSRLFLRNLLFHRRGHLAVLLGAAVGCAVLAGALLVGDSLRGSLRDRAEGQRGGVDWALVGGKFFHAQLLSDRPGVSAGIIVRGSLAAGDDRTLSGVTVLAGFDQANAAATLVPRALADALQVKPGDEVRLNLTAAGNAPRESLLGQRDLDKSRIELKLRVDRVLPDDDPLARFRLAPGALPPRNVVVPIEVLQTALAGQKGVANALLVRGGDRAALQDDLKNRLSLDDWGLTLAERSGYLAVESKQTLLEPTAAAAVTRTAAALKLRAAPTLVYLANEISVQGKQPIPYSVVAALDPTQASPLGPFLPPAVTSLKDDEIVLADWADSPLRGTPPGTEVTLTYFDPELKDGKLGERTKTFRLAGFVPMTGPAADPNLTPPFPGITDQLDIKKWDPPFPYDNTKIKPRDEKYWKDHKTTPKAYITLAAGQSLWGSRFGDVTSVRVATTDASGFKDRLLAELKPEDGGFAFDDVKARFAAASQGGQDFGGLFLAFSFFLIVSALLLVGLLTRLNLERRASELGLLLATGWTVSRVRRLMLLEGLAVATVGGLVGLAGAIGYAAAMVWLFRTLWPDAAAGSFLELHVSPLTLAIGFFATLIVNVLTIVWALRTLKHASPSALMAGGFGPPPSTGPSPWGRRLVGLAAACVVGAVTATAAGFTQTNPQFRALSFFGGGALLLLAGIAIIWVLLKRRESGPPTRTVWGLGAGNAKRNPTRSLLTATLLAAAAFLLVAVESFRRQPEKDFANRTGGSGGFPLIIETDTPVYRDPNGDGRDDMLDALDAHFQRAKDDAMPLAERKKQARDTLENVRIYPFRLRAGDDASCLNLYRANRPRLLGVPPAFASEPARFRFIASETDSPEEKENPWKVLFRERPDGAIPVAGEENTLMWMFKKGLGDEVDVPDKNGTLVKLRIVAVMKDSVFPSELLMSAPAFQRLYPRQEGYPFLLAETPPEQADAVAGLLRTGLARHGPEVTKSRDRLAAYLAVENTYLTTFQLLGGLGLLLGAVGLAVVLLRGVWERRAELALLRTVGYRHSALGLLVFAENGLLLLYGLAAGVFAALAAVVPHLSSGGSLPWLRLTVLLGLVVLSGLLAGLWAVVVTLRAPLVPALRKE